MKKLALSILQAALCCLLLVVASTACGQNLLPEVFRHIQEGDFLMADCKIRMVDTTRLSLSKKRQHLLYHYCHAVLEFEDHDPQSSRKSIILALQYRSRQEKRPMGIRRKEYRKLVQGVDALSIRILRRADEVEKEQRAALPKYFLPEPVFPPVDTQAVQRKGKLVFDSMLLPLRQKYPAFMGAFSMEMLSDTLILITCPGDSIPQGFLKEMAAASAALIEQYTEESGFKVIRLGVKGIVPLDSTFVPVRYDGRSGCIHQIECITGGERRFVSIPVGSRMSYQDWLLLQMLNIRQRFELSFSEPLLLSPFAITAANPTGEPYIAIHISLTKKS